MGNASKTALVTGASRGIGRAIALELAQNGYNIAVGYNRSKSEADGLIDTIRSMGAGAIAVQADVADEAQVAAMVAQITRNFGHVDLLVNNAGIAHQGLITDMTAAEWRRIFAVNLDGAFYCCKAVLPSMISRKRGGVVNISSMWGQIGASCEVAYSAAKAGLIGFTKALAKEVGPSGIRVNCVAPGFILTDMNAALSPADIAAIAEETPLNLAGDAADIARTVAFLAGDGAGFITGQVVGVNGGMVV